VQFLTIRGDRLDAQPGAGQPVRGQAVVQPFGEHPPGERGHVHPVQRLVVRVRDVQIGRRPAYRQWPMIEPGGEPVRQRSVEPEPAEHVGGGQRGEVTQRLDAQPAQQVGQFGPFQRLDRHRRQEQRSATRRDDLPGPRGQPGREHPVGHPHLALHRTGLGHVLDDPLGRGLLAAEVPGRPPRGQRTRARPDHLHPHRDLFDRGHHRLERPRVPPRIVLHHDQLRAATLRFASPQSPPDPVRPGRLGAGQHPVGV
jgi:hypothetical protein